MHKDRYECDGCGKLLPETYDGNRDRIKMRVDEQRDPAGANEIVLEELDVCPTCLRKAINKWFFDYKNDYGDARAFCSLIRKKGKS